MAMPTRLDEAATIEQLLALPEDGRRHELLDGVHVVTPAPSWTHQRVLQAFWHPLYVALAGQGTLEVVTSPADIVLGPRTLVQPDLFVVRHGTGARASEWRDAGVPVLAIEFLSPTTAARDRGAKRRIYQRAGVAEYWIMDLDARLVERWRPDDIRPEILDEQLVWAPPELQTPVTLDLPALFAEALGAA
ncbi:MAG: Uma2 family endonuclease [Gemmatimonadota bacterium]